MKANVTLSISDVRSINSELKKEYKSLGGAVKMLVNFDGLTDSLKKELRLLADKQPITTAKGRANIVSNIIASAKDDSGKITRKATKKERESGCNERVEKTTFSPYWLLLQIYKIAKNR